MTNAFVVQSHLLYLKLSIRSKCHCYCGS